VTPSYIARKRRYNPWAEYAANVSAGLQGLTDSVLNPVIMLSTTAYLLGGSTYEIAAFAVVASLCWSLGQYVVQPLVCLAGNTVPVTAGGLVLRIGALLLIGFLGYRIGDLDPNNAVAGLITCYGLYQVGSVVSVLSTNHHVAAAHVPAKRSRIFHVRAVLAAATATAAGVVAQSVFGSSSLSLNRTITSLLLFAAASGIGSAWFMIQIPRQGRGNPGQMTGRGPEGIMSLLRLPSMRRYLGYRIVLGFSTLADPFVVVYGLQRIGFGLRFVGLSLCIFALAQLLGTIAWPGWASSRSGIRMLQLAAFMRLMFLILAISIPALATSSFYTDRFGNDQVAAWLFVSAFSLAGVSASIHNTVNQRYLIQIAGSAGSSTRPRDAISLANGILAIAALAPFCGALLIDRFSLETALTTAGSIAFVAFIASALLVESRSGVSILGSRASTLRRRRAAT